MPQQCSYTREELAEAVRTSETIAETLREVGLVPRGGNYATLRRKLDEWDIDGSHLEATSGSPLNG